KNNYSYAIYFGGCDCCFPSAFEGKGTDYCGELAELFGRDKTVLAISGNGGPAEYCALTVGNVPRDSRPNFVYHIKRD
ncbi:MAG: hypothetical protein Q8O89_01490, partial [Nanoarchaeota archaeon]|nr:hypothetical protein [Nanoarchaeota archaeon]